jgi:predicted SAM-dependent methyltransferase
MKLNLGCGVHKLKDFVNIDLSKDYEPDLVADALNLPYEKNSASIIYVGHMIEHIDLSTVVGALKHWHDILKPGGKLYITFPDFEKAFDMWENGWLDWKGLNGVIFGMDHPDGIDANMAHRHMVSIHTLTPLIMHLFGNVKEDPECEYWVARTFWQSTLVAIKQEPIAADNSEKEASVA